MGIGTESEQRSILVIDDERSMRELLEIGLRQQGYRVVSIGDPTLALEIVRDHVWDLIICDVMMPKIDGITLLPQLRRLTEAPIVMLSAKADVNDRINGLKHGADVYCAKPFSFDELIMQLETALRRPALAQPTNLSYKDLMVDLKTRSVARGEREIDLSAREFDLLVVLLRLPEQVYSREQLLNAVWGVTREVKLGNVDTYISYLRAKIDPHPLPRLIQTIRGVGYTIR